MKKYNGNVTQIAAEFYNGTKSTKYVKNHFYKLKQKLKDNPDMEGADILRSIIIKKDNEGS